jgi:outer membrane protein
MNKKIAIAFIALALTGSAWAQQISRVAVVDLMRILDSSYTNSKAVRDYEEKKRGVQTDLDKMQQEVKGLQQKKLDAQAQGNQATVKDLDTQIGAKLDYIKNYYKVKNDELEAEKKKILESDEFAQDIYSQIQRTAELEGYSLVVDWKRASELRAVLWYSPSIDITDKVIAALAAKQAPAATPAPAR